MSTGPIRNEHFVVNALNLRDHKSIALATHCQYFVKLRHPYEILTRLVLRGQGFLLTREIFGSSLLHCCLTKGWLEVAKKTLHKNKNHVFGACS